MRLTSIFSLIASTVFALSVRANVHGNAHNNMKRHHATRDTSESGTTLTKRFSDARFTYFADGLGACGATNSDSDFIVALNSAQYGSGGFCFQMITITCNGKTTTAQITDECPGCPYAGLDMSQGLFEFFAPTSAGVLTGSWVFADAAPAPTTTSKWVAPTTSTSKWVAPTTTSIWVAPTVSVSIWVAPTTTSSTWSSTSTWSSSSVWSSSSSWSATPTSSAAPAASSTPAAISVFANFNLLFIQFGELMVAGQSI